MVSRLPHAGERPASVRSRAVLAVVVIAALCASCTAPVESEIGTIPPEATANAADAVVYEDLSDNFTLTTYPSRVYRDESGTYVSYHTDVVNKSSVTYRRFFPTLILDPELDQYFAAGVEPLPLTPVDVFPEGATELKEGKGALGVELVSDQLVADRSFLADAALDPSRILDLGQNVTLWLRWNGGEEKLTYTTPVDDPDRLLGP